MAWRVVFLLLLLGFSLGTLATARAGDLLDLHGEDSPFRNRLELVRHLTDRLNLRFGIASGQAHHQLHPGQPLVSEPWADEFSATALVDWSFSPWGLRLTGGALYGVDSNYRDVESADDSALPRERVWEEQQTFSPYFGLGLSNEFGSEGRLGLQLDLGLAFEALPAGHGEESTDRAVNSSGTLDGRLGSFFEGMSYTPVLSAGFRYRF